MPRQSRMWELKLVGLLSWPPMLRHPLSQLMGKGMVTVMEAEVAHHIRRKRRRRKKVVVVVGVVVEHPRCQGSQATHRRKPFFSWLKRFEQAQRVRTHL